MSGNVYFLLSAQARAVKIGFSVDPARRYDSLKCCAPNETELFASAPGTRSNEIALHHALDEHRLNGEWFKWDLITHELIERARAGAAIDELVDFATPGKLFTRLNHVQQPRRKRPYRTKARLAKQIEEALA